MLDELPRFLLFPPPPPPSVWVVGVSRWFLWCCCEWVLRWLDVRETGPARHATTLQYSFERIIDIDEQCCCRVVASTTMLMVTEEPRVFES